MQQASLIRLDAVLELVQVERSGIELEKRFKDWIWRREFKFEFDSQFKFRF